MKTGSLDHKSPIALSFESHGRLDPLEMLLAGKLRIVEASIEQITQEIEGREDLRNSMLNAIDKELCQQKELLYQVAPHGSATFTIGDPKRRTGIEKAIATLEAEKRHETGSAWKDIAGLNKELRILLREHEEEKRRQRVIGE
ncbi:MAG TPA: hypothetical protein PLL36_07820 [Candidatus Hydrogenedentes bacterium]|nr:hypothetical protein [Candidatus Hydrogenedentota bacterium]